LDLEGIFHMIAQKKLNVSNGRRRRLILIMAFATLAGVANAGPLVFVVTGGGPNGSGEFGTVDLTTGAFQQMGPTEPDGYFGLAPRPNGSLVSLTYAGNLDSINPATGLPTRVGPTGLENCVIPAPSCGPTSAFSLGSVDGEIYATDFQNDLYVVNPLTGAATLLSGHTGLPASPFVLGSQNPDGTFNFGDEAIWGSGGNLYVTYDAFVFNLATRMISSIVVAPELYQINRVTGSATLLGPTDLGIGGAVSVNGVSYEFNDVTRQIATINLSTGATNLIGSSFAVSVGPIQGAALTPEPASMALAGIGIAVIVVSRRRRC
jgi:hypothetical protein